MRVQQDEHIHIPHLTRAMQGIGGFRREMTQPGWASIVITDVAASHADMSITIIVGDKPSTTITGPWLTGRVFESTIMEIMMIANDALQEGRPTDTMKILADMVDKRARSDKPISLLTPIIVPVRQNWRVVVDLNEGAPPGPADIWIRTIHSRDVR